MNRSDALAVSDALVGAGISHEMAIFVNDTHVARERYQVSVKPNLSLAAQQIRELQDIAGSCDRGIAYFDRAFVFTEEER